MLEAIAKTFPILSEIATLQSKYIYANGRRGNSGDGEEFLIGFAVIWSLIAVYSIGQSVYNKIKSDKK